MDASLFETIYREDRWDGGSGPGSNPDFCRPLVGWLRRYIRDHRIASIVDLGCGDLQWMPTAIDGLGVGYTGLDVVPHLIAAHRARMPADRWSFEVLDVSSCDTAAIPAGDLYWAKDVLQHWPDETIVRFVTGFFAARPDARLVVTNCSGQTGPRRLDDRWHFAPLAAGLEPLARFRPEVLMTWGGKQVVRLRP